jgi:uncharacterized membrane protein
MSGDVVIPVKLSNLPRFRALLRRHFLGGMLVVVPLGVIVWLAVAALRSIWGLRELAPDSWRPEHYIPDPSLAFVVDLGLMLLVGLGLAAGISFIGWVSKQLLGQKILDFVHDHLIERIPVLRSIYSALDQLLRTMADEGGHQFRRVVYVEYPRKGVWALAFVTGPTLAPQLPKDYLNVYVPTTPNPTSGFHLLVAESEVKESGLSVEEAFRTILSLGIAQGRGSGTYRVPRDDERDPMPKAS